MSRTVSFLSRPFPEDGVWTNLPGNNLYEIEHVTGRGFSGKHGYPGYLIGVEKMKGCRPVQCLLRKIDDEAWKTEDDDRDFELGDEIRHDSSGIANGSRWPGQHPPQQDNVPLNEMGGFGRHMPHVRHATEGVY